MRFSLDPVENRREFLRSAARYGALGLMVAVSAVLGRSRLRGQTCVNQGVCGGCAVFNRCGLPAALSVKQHQNRAGGAS